MFIFGTLLVGCTTQYITEQWEVAMSDVKSITDPRLLSAAAPAQAIAKESNPIDPSKTVKPQAGKKEVIMPGGLDGVSMSRGIQQKLEKDGIDVGL